MICHLTHCYKLFFQPVWANVVWQTIYCDILCPFDLFNERFFFGISKDFNFICIYTWFQSRNLYSEGVYLKKAFKEQLTKEPSMIVYKEF